MSNKQSWVESLTPGTDDYFRLTAVLSDGEWHKQKNIEQHDASLVGVKVRQICSQNPTEVLGNVAHGYKLVKFATNEEIDWAVASLRSRIRKMTERADQLEDLTGGSLQAELF